jgi:hypothetical protein
LVGFDRFLQYLTLTHHLLRAHWIAPKAWIFGALIQLLQTLNGRIPVKDASEAGIAIL